MASVRRCAFTSNSASISVRRVAKRRSCSCNACRRSRAASSSPRLAISVMIRNSASSRCSPCSTCPVPIERLPILALVLRDTAQIVTRLIWCLPSFSRRLKYRLASSIWPASSASRPTHTAHRHCPAIHWPVAELRARRLQLFGLHQNPRITQAQSTSLGCNSRARRKPATPPGNRRVPLNTGTQHQGLRPIGFELQGAPGGIFRERQILRIRRQLTEAQLRGGHGLVFGHRPRITLSAAALSCSRLSNMAICPNNSSRPSLSAFLIRWSNCAMESSMRPARR